MKTLPSSPTLNEELVAFRLNPFLSMPIAGLLAWLGIGVAGAILPAPQAALAIYIATGMIFYLALFVAKLLGEDLLGRTRKGNFFDKLFLAIIAMSVLVYALAIPFHFSELSSVPLSVGVLTGLMWLPFSVMAGHWVGYFHAIARTLLPTAAWVLFPTHRFTILPAIVVALYLISIVALAKRWNALKSSTT